MTTRYFVLNIKILNNSDIKSKSKQPMRGLYYVDIIEQNKPFTNKTLLKYIAKYNKASTNGFKIIKPEDIIPVNNNIATEILRDSLDMHLGCKFMNYFDMSVNRRVYIAGSTEFNSTVSSYAGPEAEVMFGGVGK